MTLDVAGSATNYNESVNINVPAGDTLDIEGTGATQPTLDNGGTGSGFTIQAASAGAVTIDHMTISHGSAQSGGAINDLSTATLTVGFDTFSNNTATGVGGSAVGNGGAIDAGDACNGATGGTLIVTNSTFTGNTITGGSSQDGGAIDANDFHGCGGGPGTPGKLSVLDSTFQSNRAAQGGAVAAFQSGSGITNSTFASNTATGFGGGGFAGDNTALVFDTFFGNSGPVLLRDGAGGSTLANSILADAPAAECFPGSVTDNGHNVASDATCALGPNSIQNSTTIGTLTLGANGSAGPQTAAITTSSSAHNLVPAAACTVNTDERGQPRPGLGYTDCDAGAYELQKSTGYDLAGSDGGVFVFPLGQPKGFFGSLPGLGVHPYLPVVGLVPTNNYNGYNLVGADGGVFVFPIGMPSGFYGSLPGLHISVSNIQGLVGTNNNHGYNLVGSDGGVFVFPTGQSSGYYGSLPGLGIHVNNIVGIVESPDGKGYFLVGSDGGVFAFGSVQFYGSLPGEHISVNNIVGIQTTFDGKGYYLVGSDGSVYPFGDAVSHGSLPAMGIHVNNIRAVVPTADNGGYWLIGTDGGVFAFGNATFIGSLPGLTPPVRVNNIVGAVPTLF